MHVAAIPRIPGSRSEEHTSELQSHSDLHSFPTRRSSDLLMPVKGRQDKVKIKLLVNTCQVSDARCCDPSYTWIWMLQKFQAIGFNFFPIWIIKSQRHKCLANVDSIA